MKNLKFIIGFSVFGFLLSLISGFCSKGNYFGRIVLHAFIFAIVFALVALLIQFVLGKFLDMDTDISDGTPASAGSEAVPSSSNHIVDITVQDEELPADENSSQFFVGANRNMLNPDDVAEVKKAEAVPGVVNSAPASVSQTEAARKEVSSANAAGAATSPANTGFVPVSLGETPANIASVESQSHNDIKKEEKLSAMNSMPAVESDDGELDSLPDLEDLSGYTPSVSSPAAAESEVVEDSDFSRNGPESSVSAEEVTNGKDTELIAKAISTLLAKE